MPKETDHKAEALREARQYAEAADREAAGGRNKNAVAFAAVGFLYSNLAIAEGQERVAEEVKRFRDDSDLQRRLTGRCRRWVALHRKEEEENEDAEVATQHGAVREAFEDVLKEVERV